MEQFWALKLKANVYKSIYFRASLLKEMSEYVNSQRIRNISQVLHHTMVASKINFNMEEKKGFKSREAREIREQKGKNQANVQTSNAAQQQP